MTVRKVGVEEELFLVDPGTRRLSESSHHALAAYLGARDEGETGAPALEQELFLSQLETNTRPYPVLADLRDDVVRCRAAAVAAAAEAGALVVSTASPVLGAEDHDQTTTPKPRYQHIVDEFGAMGRRAVVAGMHVHVDVGEDEAVGVLDRLRPWLPVLLALSANSPFHSGVDTRHASWRAQVWGRWPTTGPSDLFGDLDGYRRATQALIDVGAAIDSGMLYLDARLAESYPTVELRVADACTEVDDVVTVAALARGLVETAAREFEAGVPPADWRIDLLRAARWRASRHGISRELVDPRDGALASSRDVVAALVAHVGDALADAGDREWVDAGVERLFSGGSGASRQRAVHESTGSLEAVVDDLAARTAREADASGPAAASA